MIVNGISTRKFPETDFHFQFLNSTNKNAEQQITRQVCIHFFFKRQAFGSDLHFSKDLIKPPNGDSGISNTRFLKQTFTFNISILQTCRATDYQTGLLLYLLLYLRPSLISRFLGLFLFSFIKLLTVAIHVLYSPLTCQSCNWKITLNQFG